MYLRFRTFFSFFPSVQVYRSVRIVGGHVEYQESIPRTSSSYHTPSDSGSATTSSSVPDPVECVDPALASLPQELCHSVIRGLLRYILALCSSDGNASLTPVISKVTHVGVC